MAGLIRGAVREVAESYRMAQFVLALGGGRWLTPREMAKDVRDAVSMALYVLAFRSHR